MMDGACQQHDGRNRKGKRQGDVSRWIFAWFLRILRENRNLVEDSSYLAVHVDSRALCAC